MTPLAWLRHYAESRGKSVRPRTRENYEHYLWKVAPTLGHVPLHKLTTLQVQGLYDHLADAGLSPSVRQHVHHFLGGALREAARHRLITRNPVEAVPAPKGGRLRAPQVWTAGQLATFLESAEDDRLYPAFYLLLTLGLRLGEVLGLWWTDLKEDRLAVQRSLSMVDNRPIYGPPKTERGQRTIYLTGDVLDVLERRRHDLELERSLAERWEDPRLIFSTAVGTPINQHNFRRSYRRLVKRAGVPRIRVHDMRHTYITLARDAGVPPEVVADRVGQDVRVTLQIYSQVTEARKRKAAMSLQELLDGEKS